jgi:lipopolysaccharide export system protein LptC
MRVTEALYRGRDSKGQPFEMRAGSAVQLTSADPVVKLQQLNARIQLTDGPAVLTAPRGRYDMDSQRVAVDGPVNFASQSGYKLATHDVIIDLPSRRLASLTPVTGTMPLGTFAADRLRGNLDDKTVVLDGHARLHIVQRTGRAGR